MKLLHAYLLTGLLSGASLSVKADTMSDMYAQVDAALQEMMAAMDTDLNVYQQWESGVYGALSDLDALDARRQALFASVQDAIMQMSSELTNISFELAQKNSVITNLETQLSIAQMNADEQVVSLQNMVSDLNAQLQQAQQEYANCVAMSDTKVMELVGSLNLLKQKYADSLGQRDGFLQLVDTLTTRLKNYGEMVGMDELALTELLSTNYDAPSVETDPESSLDLMEEVGSMMDTI